MPVKLTNLTITPRLGIFLGGAVMQASTSDQY